MKEFVEKLISRLNSVSFERLGNDGMGGQMVVSMDDVIDNINQLAEECKECYKDCKECEAYDKEKHYCPKFCKLIKDTVAEMEEEHKSSNSQADYDSIIKFVESEIERTKTYLEHETQIKIMYYVKNLKEKRSNDFCEWHKVKNGNAYKCNTHAEIHNSRVLDWCVCPYCGKKIKVVE